MNLNKLLYYLMEKNNLNLNIHDVSGLLSQAPFRINASLKMHANLFCDAAKTTKNGYLLCTRTKSLACQKAIASKQPFWGFCAYGLYELVYPIVSENKVLCILFIGNHTPNLMITQKKALKACKITHVNFSSLSIYFHGLEQTDKAYLLCTAQIIEEYIRLTLKNMPLQPKLDTKFHWAIQNIKEYADNHFKQQITLKELSKLYFMNEKYTGRLFCKQIGVSFHRYLVNLRLTYAADQLKKTDKNVLDIALESGFNSISYFNRTFYEKFGETPTRFRAH